MPLLIDETITHIETGHEGITLLREEMTGYETALTNENRQKILDLEAQDVPHSAIQRIIWRTRIAEKIPGTGKLTIDFQTTPEEDKKMSSAFDKTPTVSHSRNGQTFLRTDGLLGTATDSNEYIIELITHFHNDHISRSVVEQCLREGSFGRLIAPYPALDSSRNRVFTILEENRGITEYNFKQENRFLEITPESKPLLFCPNQNE